MLDRIDTETGEVLPDNDFTDIEFETPPDLKFDTLSGDVRDALLTRFRMLTKPWEQLTEIQQSDLVNGIDLAARQLVREVVRMVTSYDFPHCVVKLGDVKIMGGDKGIEAKISAMNIEENRSVLGEHVGDWVMVHMVDSATFLGERAAPKITPDQPSLDLDASDDGDREDDDEEDDEQAEA